MILSSMPQPSVPRKTSMIVGGSGGLLTQPPCQALPS